MIALVKPETLAKECAALNQLEEVLAKSPPPPPCELLHRFTPGLYSRTIFMPAGLICTSKIHKTEHQYVISKGLLEVWSEDTGWVLYRAPFIGTTKPGARRALRIIQDTIWTTFHPTTLTDLNEIETALIEPHDIPQQIA